MLEQTCVNISNFVEIPDLEEVPDTIEGRDLETLIVASIETLKRSNKNCDTEKVLHLVQESVDSEVTKEHLEELPDKLIKCHSVKIKFVGKRTCLSLSKGVRTQSSKQCIESLRININEELYKFKDSVIEELNALKPSFLVDSFKKRYLVSCCNNVLVENSERLINYYKRALLF